MTILIVDDNEQNMYQLQVLLTAYGYQIVAAANGADALVKARQAPPDLIISDILMPVMDGFALCRDWKKDERLRTIPFIFYTATYTDERDRDFALGLGAARFIVKPEEPDVIIQAIQEILQQVQSPPHPVGDTCERVPVEMSPEDETGYLQQYNSALIRKLENKMQQLEKANRELEQGLAEQKQAKAALQFANLVLSTQQETAIDGILVVDENGKILSSNRRFADIWGIPSDILRSNSDERALLSVMDQLANPGEFIQKVRKLYTARHELSRDEIALKDGRTFDRYSAPMFGADDKYYGRVWYFRDITERKRAEEKLQASNHDLQQAMDRLQAMQDQMIRQERLSALGQMAAGIVHDFNNALVPIMANADYFLANPTIPDDKAALTQGLKEILRGAEDAKSIVHRLKEFYRPQDETMPKPVNLGEVLKSVVSMTQSRWHHEPQMKGLTVEVRTETPAAPVYVNGHEFELREALTNLVLNAVDALPQGGLIAVRCRQEGACVILEVGDNGTGMTLEVQKHCFEPFFSTKGAQGTGLGLAMVYGIVRRHNGTITVESEMGKGTTFRIIFPSKLPEVEGSEPAQAAAPQLSPQRILLIDDDIMALKTIARFLIREGHKVQTAQNGMQGIQILREESFDMVITDRALTGMSGDEVAKTVKGVYPDMPIILLTGFGGIMNVCGEKPPGVDVVLGKPAMKDDVIEALRQALKAKAHGKVPALP